MPETEDIKYIKNHFSREDLVNLYVFYGPENYLKDLYTARVKAKLACDALNTYFFGTDADPKEIAELCSSVSLFGEDKLIIVSGSGMFKNACDPSFLDAVKESRTYLVFKEEEVDKRGKLYKKACELGIVFHCKRQPPAEIKRMLAYTVKSAGRMIEEKTLQYLLDGIGEDLARLTAETEKLTLYVPEGGMIEKKHVDALCNITYSARLFDLNDAIAGGDRERAYRIMQSLTEAKEPPVKILAILSKMWSQLYSVKLLSQGGANTAEIAAGLGIKEFAAAKLARQASGMSLAGIERKINLCEELDLSVKSGLLKDLTALELLTVQEND